MYAEEIRRAAETVARVDLPLVAAALWRALAEEQVTEVEAEELSGLIAARQTDPGPSDKLRKPVGSRPRTDASMERRRKWAASGRLPPALAARFTLAEQAVLALVAAETCRRKDCRLAIEHIGALVGVSRSTVKNAIREAAKLGLLTIEERRLSAWRSDTNVVRIISAEWSSWLRLTRQRKDEREAVAFLPSKMGGVKSLPPTHTQSHILGIQQARGTRKKAAERVERLPHDPADDPRRFRAG